MLDALHQNVQQYRTLAIPQRGGIFIKTYQFTVTSQCIEAPKCAVFVSGSAEIYEAAFAFDASWDGFARTAVFECAGERREQLMVNDRCIVPWEILKAGAYLRVGVYGVDGNATMPTVYSGTMFVARGAEPSEAAREHSADMFDQIVEIGQQAAEDREAAESAAKRAEDAAGHNPYPNAETGTWWVWDAENEAYRDSGVSVNPGYQIGSGLKLDTATNTLSVDTADAVEQDNTKPITSAAVFAEVGNIAALLAAL